MMTRKIVFFGASEGARQAWRRWPSDLSVSFFVDNDPAKWGSTFEGLPVRDPSLLADEPLGSVFIVIASRWYEDIARQLGTWGFSPRLDFADPGEAVGILRASTPDLPASDAVAAVFEDHWFGVDYDQLREHLAHAGIRAIPARLPSELARLDLDIDRDTCRALRVSGVPLFDACFFDVCVALGVTPDRFNPDSASHWNTLVEHMRCAAAAATIIGRWLDWARPDAVVIPQGHLTVCAVYRYLAVLRGIRVIALEFSLDRRLLVWDDVAGIAVNRIPARNYYWRWADLVDPRDARRYVDEYLASIRTVKTDDHRSPNRHWPGAEAGRPVVLYLANVLTDSSVLFNSRVGSQVDAIRAVARWAVEHGCTFVLKIHPRERPGSPVMRRAFPPAEYSYEGLTIAALQEDVGLWQLLSTSGQCVVDADNRYDTCDLIRRSDVCVTVCSQAGLEALLLGRETVVLGEAYYGGLGFTHDVQSLEQVGPALAAALDPDRRRADEDRIARFFYVFARIYCIERSTVGVASLVRRTLGRERLPVLPATA